MTISFSERVDGELRAIYVESAERFGIPQAERYLASLHRSFVFLASNPRITREREELISRARAYRHQAHMIIYREEADGILIIRLPHARSDWINDPD